DLIDDLADREVPHETHLTGRAERARHRAARLRREADRVARAVVRHQYRFDVVRVVQAQQRLARLAVGAGDLRLRLDRAEAERARKEIAERLRQIRKLVPARLGAACDVPPDLPRAVRGLLAVAQPVDERSLIDIADRGTS